MMEALSNKLWNNMWGSSINVKARQIEQRLKYNIKNALNHVTKEIECITNAATDTIRMITENVKEKSQPPIWYQQLPQ